MLVVIILTAIFVICLTVAIILTVTDSFLYGLQFTCIFLAALAGVGLLICGIVVLDHHIHKDIYIEAYEIERATLIYELEQYENGNEATSTINLDLLPRINAFNTKIITSHMCANNPWDNWFTIDYSLYIPIIELD